MFRSLMSPSGGFDIIELKLWPRFGDQQGLTMALPTVRRSFLAKESGDKLS